MYRKETLLNRVRVVTEEVPFVHSVAVGIWVRAGSRNENEGNHGVSHFIEHLFFKGTTKRTAQQIAEELEAVGGVLNAFTTKEYTCFYAKVLREHFDLATEVLADMFFNSLMDQKDIDKEKNVILEEIKMYEDSPDELVHDLFAHTVWKGHPLGRTILGTAESIRQLSREDILNYYREFYTADNVVIAVAGNIKHEEVLEEVAVVFSQVVATLTSEVCCTPVPHAAVLSNTKDTEQVQICLGTPGLAQEDTGIYSLQALNNILGGGLSSRLFQQIREERGLAYAVYSYHAAYLDSGLFAIYAGTSPANLKELICLTLAELAKIKNEGVTEQELKRTKDQIKGNLLLTMENVGNRMSRLGRTLLCYGRVITAEEMVEHIANVQIDEVTQLARELFTPEKFSLTTIGPLGEDIDFTAILKDSGV